MQVIEGQRLDARVVQVALHGGADLGQLVFMHQLVGFQVEGPVPGAVEQGDALLLAIHVALDAVIAADALVPLRQDDAYFRVADLAQQPFRLVLAGPSATTNSSTIGSTERIEATKG